MTRHAWIVGALALAVLVLTADYQIYDNNFYTLSEATALLAGEHPYRDFYEWGVPLQAFLSAATQYLIGYRFLSEFLLQWTFTVAAVVIAFHLSVRLSRSVSASFVMMLPVILNLAASPTYQYTKLFIYPCAILLAWRYMERPGPGRGAVLGLITAIAFFFRHDHGIYVGAAVLLAIVLAAVAHPDVQRPRMAARDLAVCALTGAVCVIPWAIVVAHSEGLFNYVQARAYINDKWAVRDPVFLTLFHMNPIRALTPDPTVSADADPYERLLAWLPGRSNAQTWLQQVTLLTTVCIVVAALAQWFKARRDGVRAPEDTFEMLLAGALVLLVERQLFRETSYFVMVFPLAAAFGARLLTGPPSPAGEAISTSTRVGRAWHVARRSVAVAVLAITTVTVAGYVRESNVLQPVYQLEHLPRTIERLVVSPPIDGFVSSAYARGVDAQQWQRLDAGGKSDIALRYVHDCTAPGDHVLVSGLTPYQVGYYAARPVAGGHLYWHDGWRSDPVREAQSLDLLKRQSVPFAVSTSDGMLENLQRYPHIRAYVEANYVEIAGIERPVARGCATPADEPLRRTRASLLRGGPANHGCFEQR
jgi:hypothetical protein